MVAPFNIDGISMQRDAFLLFAIVQGSGAVLEYYLSNRSEFLEDERFPETFAEIVASDLLLSLSAKVRNSLDGHGWHGNLPAIGRLTILQSKMRPLPREVMPLFEKYDGVGRWTEVDFREGCNKILHAEAAVWGGKRLTPTGAKALTGTIVMSGSHRESVWLCELDVRKFSAYVISQF